MSKIVCVVGAGVAGLASIKHCLEEGFDVVCYEKDTDVGGLWNYHPKPKDGDPSLYNSCSINTSKEMSCFSDFPIPKEFPNFMDHKHFKKYLCMYAEKFNLRHCIKFEHSVDKIEKVGENNRWKVTSRNVVSGKCSSEMFDFVMVCNGHLHEPNMPTFPGLDRFKGKVMHTHDFKTFHGYEGKRILVVGIGNSGADVATELSRHAEHVYVSTRRGSYVIQRAAEYGIPFDHLAINRFSQSLPWDLMRPVHYHKINYKYNHSNYGLSPNFRFDGGVVTISDDLPNRILLGAISIKSNVEKFTENGVQFDDSSVVENIDVVILATGFKYSFPFLEDSVVEVDNHFAYLYELVFPVDLQPSTLAVIGLVQPFGSLPPILEMQARWASKVFSGKCTLPSSAERRQIVEKRRQFLKTKYVDSPRYSLQIYFIDYLDNLASRIGCKPNLIKYFFTNPKFWYKLYFGPATPPQWRLDGPGKWSGARKSIESVEENTYYPMKTRQSGTGERDGLYDGWIKLLRRVLFALTFIFILRFIFCNGYGIFSIKV